MSFDWLRFRRRRQTRPAPEDRRGENAEPSEEETDLLKRIAAGIALNKFPPRQRGVTSRSSARCR
jgi:DNA-directed RNA polymerase specialized sigma24 family protein